MVTLLTSWWANRRSLAEALLVWSGLGRVYELCAHPAGAVILMYHSVADFPAATFVDPLNHLPLPAFARQMLFLRRHRRVVSLDEVVAALDAGVDLPAGTVCITFDDGYLDSLEHAAPLLRQLGLPATVFLATANANSGLPQWADLLHAILMRRTAQRLRVPELGLDTDLGQGGQLTVARSRLHLHLLQALPDQRSATLAVLQQQLRPQLADMPRLVMTWAEVRRLRDEFPLIEIGGHTRFHTDLSVHGGEVAAQEVSGCAADLRSELGRTPRWFAFPYGRCTADARQLLQRSGWRAAMGDSSPSRIRASTDPFNLPRLETPRSMSELRFRTSGAFPGALALLGRRPS